MDDRAGFQVNDEVVFCLGAAAKINIVGSIGQAPGPAGKYSAIWMLSSRVKGKGVSFLAFVTVRVRFQEV